MKHFSLRFLLLVLFISANNMCGLSQDLPELTHDNLPGFTIDRNESFDGESLWGYMNGGADIYLEYGFEILRVQEILKDGERIKLEAYKMDSPLSAFGIYSFKTFKCSESKVLHSNDCLNKYQYQIYYGDYYIQLINETGSEKAKLCMLDIAATIMKKIEYKDADLPDLMLINNMGFATKQLKLLKGKLGIQNSAMFLEDCFKGIVTGQVYFVRIKDKGKFGKYIEVLFESIESKEQFKANCNQYKISVLNESESALLLQKQ